MELKDYQQGVLTKFSHYLSTLREQVEKIAAAQEVLKAQNLKMDLGDPCVKAWDQLNEERRLPYLKDEDGNDRVADYLRRLDGLQRSIPNVTLKVPTGGGKTLLATAAVEMIQVDFFRRQTGFVLWVVPSDAIYKQTWKQLANREHPYRQMLERASGGRVKMLEKGDAFCHRSLQNPPVAVEIKPATPGGWIHDDFEGFASDFGWDLPTVEMAGFGWSGFGEWAWRSLRR